MINQVIDWSTRSSDKLTWFPWCLQIRFFLPCLACDQDFLRVETCRNLETIDHNINMALPLRAGLASLLWPVYQSYSQNPRPDCLSSCQFAGPRVSNPKSGNSKHLQIGYEFPPLKLWGFQVSA